MGVLVQVWENLRTVARNQAENAAAAAAPPADYFLADNYNNSYLTMLSESGLIFGVINIVGNFGTVFVDQVCMLASVASNIRIQQLWSGQDKQ